MAVEALVASGAAALLAEDKMQRRELEGLGPGSLAASSSRDAGGRRKEEKVFSQLALMMVRMMIQKEQRLPHTKRQTSRTPTQWQEQDERDVDVELQHSTETEEAQPLVAHIFYWSTGNLASTVELYSRSTLFTSTLSTFGWHLYGALQLSFHDKVQVIGIDAVQVNAVTWGVQCFMMLFLVIYRGRASGKAYVVSFIVHMVVMGILLLFPIFKLLSSTGKAKDVVGAFAGVMQVISQLIPLIQLAKEWKKGPALGQQLRNRKKLTVLSRSIDFIVTLYWMLYRLLTYKFDAFAISNIICSILSLVSLVLHSAWAISPPPDHITIPEIEALPADKDSGKFNNPNYT
uniref:Uncharacterized protein n=1 Tax=Oryza punctata TaxID=4537 RepID=A0A0E0JLX4_ORYPU